MNPEMMNEVDDNNMKSMQAIVALMVLSIVGVAIGGVIMTGGFKHPSLGITVSIVGVMFAAFSIVMRLFVQNVTEQSAANDPEVDEEDLPVDSGELKRLYAKQCFAGMLMLEGAALVNVFAFLREHNWWSLVVAFLVTFSIVAAAPTRHRVNQWVETRRRRVA